MQTHIFHAHMSDMLAPVQFTGSLRVPRAQEP